MACIDVQKDVVAQHGHLMYYGFPPKAILRKKRAELTIGHHCASPEEHPLKRSFGAIDYKVFAPPPLSPQFPPTFLPQHQNKTRIQRTTYKFLFLIVVIISMVELFLNFIFYETSFGGHGTCRHFW